MVGIIFGVVSVGGVFWCWGRFWRVEGCNNLVG